MAQDDSTTWQLTDPRPIAARAPYTFHLPSDAEIEAITVGDLVKVIFEYFCEVDEYGAERMWLTVNEIAPDALIGTLDNTPFEPRAPVQHGAVIRFQRHNVIDIQWLHPEQAPPSQPSRQHFDRCLVDQCVLDGEEPIEYLYRETPDMTEERDKYPDSGWRIRGRRGDASDAEYDSRKAVYRALGLVLNSDDSWLHLIDRPEGSAFKRDFTTGEYCAVD